MLFIVGSQFLNKAIFNLQFSYICISISAFIFYANAEVSLAENLLTVVIFSIVKKYHQVIHLLVEIAERYRTIFICR